MLGRSSTGRAVGSGPTGWGFNSLRPCYGPVVQRLGHEALTLVAKVRFLPGLMAGNQQQET